MEPPEASARPPSSSVDAFFDEAQLLTDSARSLRDAAGGLIRDIEDALSRKNKLPPAHVHERADVLILRAGRLTKAIATRLAQLDDAGGASAFALYNVFLEAEAQANIATQLIKAAWFFASELAEKPGIGVTLEEATQAFERCITPVMHYIVDGAHTEASTAASTCMVCRRPV